MAEPRGQGEPSTSGRLNGAAPVSNGELMSLYSSLQGVTCSISTTARKARNNRLIGQQSGSGTAVALNA